MDQARLEHMDAVDADFEENTMAQEETRIEKDILAEFQADGSAAEWRVKIKKVNARTKKQDDCFEISPDEIRNVGERLEEEYGAGEYRLYVMRDDKLKHNLRLGIAQRKQRNAPDSAGSVIAELSRTMERQTEQIANLIQRGSPTAAPAPSNPMEMMQGMMTMMVTMKEFLTPAGGGEKHGSVSEFMELWGFARELAGERGGGESTAAEIFREFMKSPIASELADAMRDHRSRAVTQQPRPALAAPAAASPAPAVKPASPGILHRPEMPGTMRPGGAAAANLHAENAGASSAPAPDPAPAVNGAALPADLADLDPAMRGMLKGVVDYWVSRAELDSSPGLYAELALDNYPVEVIRAVLLREDLRTLAASLNPKVESHWEWFAELVEELKDLLRQAERDEQRAAHVRQQPSAAAPSTVNGDPGREGRHSGDSVDHAGARPPRPEESGNQGEGG